MTIDWRSIDGIATLIEKRIRGEISEEESEVLQLWRNKSSENEKLYQQMLDMTFLQEEYRRIRLVDVQRPMEDMHRRIRTVIMQRRHRILWRSSAAAAVSIAAIWALIFFLFPSKISNGGGDLSNMKQMIAKTEKIVAGSTRAMLTLSNGSSVNLGSNSKVNISAINQALTNNTSSNRHYNILATPRGGEFKVTLEDGTVVWLNAQSQLCYPDSFAGNERRVRLVGEGYFHVAKNDKKPFFVETAGQVVRVYGTEFNINSYREDKVVCTTLVNGKISLFPANGSQAELILTPGHQAIFSKSDASTSIRSVDTDVMTSWRRGMFVFEDQTLEQIMQTLSRWYNFTFEFKSRTAASTVFMGSMSRYSDFNDVLHILEQSGDLRFRITGHHVVISLK